MQASYRQSRGTLSGAAARHFFAARISISFRMAPIKKSPSRWVAGELLLPIASRPAVRRNRYIGGVILLCGTTRERVKVQLFFLLSSSYVALTGSRFASPPSVALAVWLCATPTGTAARRDHPSLRAGGRRISAVQETGSQVRE